MIFFFFSLRRHKGKNIGDQKEIKIMEKCNEPGR